MSKKIFINNLNTFVSKALLEELKKKDVGEDGEEVDAGDAPVIYGTYIDKDSSSKPEGVKKMLKVSCNCYINVFYSEIQTIVGYVIHGWVRLNSLRFTFWRPKRCQTRIASFGKTQIRGREGFDFDQQPDGVERYSDEKGRN